MPDVHALFLHTNTSTDLPSPPKGHQYALKIVEKQLVLRHRVAHHVQRERRILDALNGQRGIVGLHFTFQDEQHVYFGLQPCLNGV